MEFMRRPKVLAAVGVLATLLLALLVVTVLYQSGDGSLISDNAALIGALIALGGVFTTQMVTTALDDQRARANSDLEDLRSQETKLQKYLEDMGTLLTDGKLLESQPKDTIRTVARAHTLTLLEAVKDPTRKRILIVFLYEANVLNAHAPILVLRGSNLQGIDLQKAYLAGINLQGTNLQGIDLRNADLTQANLSEVDLREANLSEAILRGANLNRAKLTGANLTGATLTGATLTGADLTATDLSNADLRGLDLWDIASLENAILKHADLKPYITGYSVDNEELTKGMDLGEWERSIAGYKIASTIGHDEISHGHVYLITDLSFANLKGADLENADLRFIRLHETKLQGATLARSDLRGATDSERVVERESYLDKYPPRQPGSFVPNEWLERQACSIEGATMPDGSRMTNSQHRNDS